MCIGDMKNRPISAAAYETTDNCIRKITMAETGNDKIYYLYRLAGQLNAH